MKVRIAVIGLVALPLAWAADEPTRLNLKATGEYFLIDKTGTAGNPTLVVKRIGPSGTSYTRRAFDCAARTAMHVGTADTLEAMAKAKPDAKMTALTKDSVTEQLWHYACGR